MLVFTSCTNNYIPKARVLASSLKKFHPDWEFCLLLGETPPQGFDIQQEPFDRILFFEDIHIPEYHAWLFRHRVVEICTAAKGPALNYFVSIERQKKVIYLDPDIMVLNSLSPLEKLLDEHDILLTPHQLAPQQSHQAILDNEICSLKHGIYNLGFVAVAGRDQGYTFSQWWSNRLYSFCYDDIPNGLFTDQRWCDLAPAFFPHLHIIRDPGYNAATWNLTDREITQDEGGRFMANKLPLRFYHFTGYDSGAGQRMAEIYGKKMPAVAELWKIYASQLESFDHATLKREKWRGMFFDDGTPISDDMRFCYRNSRELQETFPNPFKTIFAENSYLTWYQKKNSSSKLQKVNQYTNKISTAYNLVRLYINRHGGISKGLPKLFSLTLTTFKQKGFKGIIDKFRAAKHHAAQRKHCEYTLGALISQATSKDCTFRNLLQKYFSLESKSICIIDHQYGGGAENYTTYKINKFQQSGKSILRITWDLLENNITATAYTPEGCAAFKAESIREVCSADWLHFSKVILNELVTWSIAKQRVPQNPYWAVPLLLHDIRQLVEKHSAVLEIPIHDYFSLCPSYTLLNAKDTFCNLPVEVDTVCKKCLSEHADIDIQADFDLKEWRIAWQKIFDCADNIIFFSKASLDLVQKVFVFDDSKIRVQPHEPLGEWGAKYEIPQNSPMTIAVIGTIATHKGAKIISDMLPLLAEDEKVVVIGEYYGKISSNEKMCVHGRYQRAELPQLLAHYNVSIGLVPSICPETFNYVTQECMLLGLPTVAFNLGAQGDRIGQWEHGLLAEEITADSAYATLRKLDSRRNP